MKRASYRHAVEWIASNDDVTRMDAAGIAGQISVVLVADIFDVSPERVAGDVVRREPWMVEAWLPRELGAARKVAGRYESPRMAGGHLARVRSLRDRRRTATVADWILLASRELAA